MYFFLVSFISAFLTYYLLRFLIPILRRGILDKPNSRSSHESPQPVGGGIAFVFVSVLICSFQGNWIPLACLPLAIVGFLDDIYKLSSNLRYFVQFSTVFGLLLISKPYFLISYELPFQFFFLINILIIVFATAIINFINFMDGLDGIVAGCMFIVFLSASVMVAPNIFPLVGSLGGFLFFNWSPAKVFMGDVGSTFIGAVYAGYVLLCEDLASFLSLILIASPLLFDAFTCVIIRFFNGQNIFRAHKQHLYQRLNQSGWSHSAVSSLYIGLTSILALVSFTINIKYLFICSFLVFILGIVLDSFVAVDFNAKIT